MGGRFAALAMLFIVPLAGHASLLTTYNYSAQSTCMVKSDGTFWTGGAIGLQGNNTVKYGGGSPPLAGSVALKFNIGSLVDTWNAAYGAGNWSVSNIKLTFQYTLYANNTTFGAGAGTFDIYWVNNDSWGTGSPIFAANGTTLSQWSTGQSLVASEYYSWSTPGYTGTVSDLGTSAWATDKSGNRQANMICDLAATSAMMTDILGASSSANSSLSLYLLATEDTTGLTIFNGGGTITPTLSFEVVSVPEPGCATLALLGFGTGLAIWKACRRRMAANMPNHFTS